MTNKTTSTTRFTLDFFNKTISGTKASFNKAKRTYDGLDYKFMEDYIATFEDDILSNTYESVKKLAKDQGLAVYPMTKKWVLARFSSEEEGFGMNAGREKITN